MSDIKLREVTKRYGDGHEAVHRLDLDIDDGEFMILVGPSGCGKSTALRMVAGLERISEGDLVIDGEVVNDRAAKDRDVAMVFQNYALYPHMTVRENMGFALRLLKMKAADRDAKVTEAARVLDLEDHLDRRPGQLSGGQRQRVAMGRAIVRDPKAFLMDEPLSNLDAKLRVQMRAEVSQLQRRLGTTTLYVTHDQTEAMTLGDRVAVLRGGVLQQVDTPTELYERPGNLFVAGFIGSPAMNFLAGTLNGDAVTCALGRLELPARLRAGLARRTDPSREVVVGLRPQHFEDAELVSEEERARRGAHEVEVDVDLVEKMGSETYAYFTVAEDAGHAAAPLADLAADLGAGDALVHGGTRVVARVRPESAAAAGTRMRLWLDGAQVHLFEASTGQSLAEGRS